jgi:hypothetical protein
VQDHKISDFTILHLSVFDSFFIIKKLPPFDQILEKAANVNFKVLSLTRTGLKPTMYRTQDEHTTHCTTDVVGSGLLMWWGVVGRYI